MMEKAFYIIEWDDGSMTSTECEVNLDDHTIHNIGKIKKRNKDMSGEYIEIGEKRYLAANEDFRFDESDIFYYQ